MLILQLRRLNLLELLRQGRHLDRGRRGEKENCVRGDRSGGDAENSREKKRYSEFLAELSISIYEPLAASRVLGAAYFVYLPTV